jgi:signal transduction histidine kinase
MYSSVNRNVEEWEVSRLLSRYSGHALQFWLNWWHRHNANQRVVLVLLSVIVLTCSLLNLWGSSGINAGARLLAASQVRHLEENSIVQAAAPQDTQPFHESQVIETKVRAAVVEDFLQAAAMPQLELTKLGWVSWTILGASGAFIALIAWALASPQNLWGRISKSRKMAVPDSQAANEKELALRRLGADLHDGPGQLITFALLKLEGVLAGRSNRQKDYEAVRSALRDALDEIRNISSGLMLPGIDSLALGQAISFIVEQHKKRTDTAVGLKISGSDRDVGDAAKLCLCRFVQEGLANAFKHAGGAGQKVTVKFHAGSVEVEVSDTGKGSAPLHSGSLHTPLGLEGIRQRIASLGGQFSKSGAEGHGVRLTASLPLDS